MIYRCLENDKRIVRPRIKLGEVVTTCAKCGTEVVAVEPEDFTSDFDHIDCNWVAICDCEMTGWMAEKTAVLEEEPVRVAAVIPLRPRKEVPCLPR